MTDVYLRIQVIQDKEIIRFLTKYTIYHDKVKMENAKIAASSLCSLVIIYEIPCMKTNYWQQMYVFDGKQENFGSLAPLARNYL